MSPLRGPLMFLLGIVFLLACYCRVIRFFGIQPVDTSSYPQVKVHPVTQALLMGGFLLIVLGSVVAIFHVVRHQRSSEHG